MRLTSDDYEELYSPTERLTIKSVGVDTSHIGSAAHKICVFSDAETPDAFVPEVDSALFWIDGDQGKLLRLLR